MFSAFLFCDQTNLTLTPLSKTNLARRAAKENKEQQLMITHPSSTGPMGNIKKKQFIKIGRPGYNIKKIREPSTARLGLLFQIQLPEIAPGVKPIKRFMSSFEQRKEPVNRAIQYFMVAAEPYETIAFAIPAREIVDVDEDPESTWEFWDPDTKSEFALLGMCVCLLFGPPLILCLCSLYRAVLVQKLGLTQVVTSLCLTRVVISPMVASEFN